MKMNLLRPAPVPWEQRFAVARAICGAKLKVHGEAKAGATLPAWAPAAGL